MESHMKNIARTLATAAFLAAVLALPLSAQKTAPDADAEYVDVQHEYTLQDDGTIVYRYEHHLRYLTSFAFNRAYGETFIVYNPAWQTLKITDASTRMADGRDVKAPFNAFNEVLPGFAANAAPYMHLREMVVTHTGLERGSVAHLAYTITTKKGFLPGLSARVLIGDRSPIRRFTVRVKFPAGQTLYTDLARDTTAPVTSKDGQANVLTWTFPNVAMMPVETQQPGMEQVLPVLTFATTTEEAVRTHINPSYTLNEAARALATSLTANASDATQKAFALRAHVENTVGTMSGDLGYIGYQAQTAQQTFERNVGSTLDRAILLAALIRAVGFDADAVLVGPGLPRQAPHAWNNAAVLVRLPGTEEPLLLDPGAAQYDKIPYRLSGKALFALSGAPAPPGVRGPRTENRVALDFRAAIAEDGIVSGTVVCDYGGVFSSEMDPARRTTQLKRAMASCVQGVKVTEDKDGARQQRPTAAQVLITSTRPLEARDGLAAISMPQLPAGVDDLHVNLGLEQRRTPIDVGNRGRYESKVLLRIPPNTALASIPREQNVSNNVGEVRCVVRANAEGVVVARTLLLMVSPVPPEQYADLRALLAVWQDPSYRTLYLTGLSR